MRTKIKPSEISNPDYLNIYNRLKLLNYPCCIVVYGPSRNHRTTYRGENEEAFAIDMCSSYDEAWKVVDCGFVGHPNELKIYRIGPTGEEPIALEDV